MARLVNVGKTREKEMDLVVILRSIFNEAERNTNVIWAHQIPYFLTDLNCEWLRRFLAQNDFIYGSIIFTLAELQEALTKLVQTGFLKIHLFEVKESREGVRVGFSQR